MFATVPAFSSFAVRDVEEARRFYGDTLGLQTQVKHGMLTITLASGASVLLYPKDNHEPASHTVLMFPVPDILAGVAEAKARGIQLEHFEGVGEDGIMPGSDMGPANAWFKDPSGNWISIVESMD